jgi:peptide subunit release factor 1 (eRF1)
MYDKIDDFYQLLDIYDSILDKFYQLRDNKYFLSRLVEFLSSLRSWDNTKSLVSLYLPHKSNIDQNLKFIKKELVSANKIKRNTTKKPFINALKNISNFLSRVNSLPETGIILFAGRVKEKEIFLPITAPFSINEFSYECNSIFNIDSFPKYSSYEKISEKFGIILIDSDYTTFFLLSDVGWKEVFRKNSDVPAKGAINHWRTISWGNFSKVYQESKDKWYKYVIKKIIENLDFRGVSQFIIGGPGASKEKFADLLTKSQDFKGEILQLYPTSSSRPDGVFELLEKAMDNIISLSISRQMKIVDNFLEGLVINPDNFVYGYQDLVDYIVKGVIPKTIIVSDQYRSTREFNQIKQLLEEKSHDVTIEIIYSDNKWGKMFENFQIAGILFSR